MVIMELRKEERKIKNSSLCLLSVRRLLVSLLGWGVLPLPFFVTCLKERKKRK